MEEMGGADVVREEREKNTPLAESERLRRWLRRCSTYPSEQASLVTGVALPVDGGRIA